MLELFSNNAEGVLSAGVSEYDNTLQFTSASGFAVLAPGQFQRATITHANMPGEYEIVFITSWDGLEATADRGMEPLTYTGKVWPAGAKVSGRLTAGMLRGVVDSGLRYSSAYGTDTYGVLSGGRMADEYGAPAKDVGVLGGFSVSPPTVNNVFWDAGGPVYSGVQPRGMETVFITGEVELGQPEVHSPSTNYAPGSIVVPAVSDGYQYRLVGNGYSFGSISFPGDGYSITPVPAYNPSDPGSPKAAWVTAGQHPAKVVTRCHDIITEVGFITNSVSGVSVAPTFSVGVEGDETALANNVAVPIQDYGVSRFIVPSGVYPGFLDVVFKVHTPSPAGSLKGVFYARGFDVNR